jgi:hypothetical protein
MGFDCNLFCEQTASAIGQMGYSLKEASHAIGELSKACSSSSSLSRLPVRPSTIIKMSIVRKSSLPERQTTKNATLTVDNAKINWDVLEKSFGPFNKGDLIFHK